MLHLLNSKCTIMKLTPQEIEQKTIEVLAEEFEGDPSAMLPDAPMMETLDLDSLDIVDVVVLVDKTFGVTLKREDFATVHTFQDFFSLIGQKLND